jgi:ABC-2 type transport system permease protein
MKPSIVLAAPAVVLSRRPNLGALGALFAMTLRQHVRGRRLWVLCVLFVLPAVLAAVVNLASRVPLPVDDLEFPLIFNLIPHALAPLAALLYAAGIIQDEVEEQTLTYLLIRPLPRWAVYWVKLLAAVATTSLLTAAFTMATFATIVLTAKTPWTAAMITHAMKTAGLLMLVQVAYCGLFGLLGLLMRRVLLVGVAYVVLFEGLLASIDTVARRLTIMYYFRVLAMRWLNPASAGEWSVNLTTAPSATMCVLTLLGMGVLLGAIAAVFFSRREFRMKTPEGN